MPASWNSIVQVQLILAGFIGSTLVWGAIWRRISVGLPVLEPSEQPASCVPRGVVIGVLAWLSFQIWAKIVSAGAPPQEISLIGLQLMCGINLLIAALLPLALLDAGRRTPSEVGISLHAWSQQLTQGTRAFLAAIWPTALLLILSSLWRDAETQHSMLQALHNQPDMQLIAWIIFSAVIVAPLAEELLFRVTLQSWLSEWLPRSAAIGVTAAIFALVHGWRDALPLLPLALILGYQFQQTRRYWACVMTHALFNASNLAMVLLGDHSPAT